MSEVNNHTTKLLSEIIQEISSLLSVGEIIEKVYENVNKLMDASVFAIGLYDPATDMLVYPSDIEKGEKLPSNSTPLTETHRFSVLCFTKQKEVLINDFYNDHATFFPGSEVPEPSAGEQTESLIYLPLLIRNKPVGVISVQSFQKNAYTDYHLNILRSLGVSIAGVLEKARIYENMEEEVKARTMEVIRQKEEIEHSYNNVKILRDIGKQITSSLSVEKIIETAYANINQLMDASSFWIGIYNPATSRLEYPLGIERGKTIGFASYNLSDDMWLPVWCFKNQKEAFVNDYLKEYNNYMPGKKAPVPVAGEMPESSIWIPLVSKEKETFGILTIQSFEKNAYTEYHLDIARNIAVFASIGLENALLYEQVEQKVKERTSEVVKQKEEIEQTYQNIKLLSEIGQQVTSSLSVEKIIETAYDNVNRLMDASVFWIGIYNEDEHRLDFRGAIEKAQSVPFFFIAADDPDRLASWCFNNRKPIFINDLEKEFKKFIPHRATYTAVVGDVTSSLIYLPLISKNNKQVGVITVQSFRKHAYTDYHLDMLKSVAVFVDIALENALMYEEVEQKVIERTAQVVKQKEELEEKNKDITDSINYAKRIQEAILPPMEVKEQLFPDSFILFHPRDIVSGDFYWFGEKNGKRLMAAVDCTGHGVPGAFMSMIGNSFLNEIVHERGVTQPDLILNKLRELVIHSLRQSEAENKAHDGMDISLLSFERIGTGLTVNWAGANNPLWVIRGEEWQQYNPDKRPISYSRGESISFTNHTIDLEKGDTLYIFSDGFADQFGGEKGKKFKYKQLKEKLLSFQRETMARQSELLLDAFRSWKGTLEQVDDVLIIGVRI